MGYAVSTGIRPFVSAFSSMVYAFHMPAFIALSGALFIKGYDNGKWSSFSRLLKAKFSRILLPCIVVWFAYNVPLKFISGYYDDSSLSRAFLQFFFPNNVYLWYLESLFLCFILAWLILRFSGKNIKSLVIVITLWTVGYLLQHRNAAYVPLGNPFKNLFWFWMGVYIDSVAAWIDDRIKNNRAFVCVILTALWFVLYFALVMIVKAHLILRFCRQVVNTLVKAAYFALIAEIFEHLPQIRVGNRQIYVRHKNRFVFLIIFYKIIVKHLLRLLTLFCLACSLSLQIS